MSASDEAYALALLAYDKDTYGQLAANHEYGLHAAVDAVWPLAFAAGECRAYAVAEEKILSEQRPNPIFDTYGVVLAARVVRQLAARLAEGTTADSGQTADVAGSE